MLLFKMLQKLYCGPQFPNTN